MNQKTFSLSGRKIRYCLLLLLFTGVILAQHIPGWGEYYARHLYPLLAAPLSRLSGLIPFAVGDVFIFLSLAGILLYPLEARLRRKKRWKHIAARLIEYLLWIYVWFYAAWGLNYSQDSFYQRTQIPYVAYTPENFHRFTKRYTALLNASYTELTAVDISLIRQEVTRGYLEICDSLGINRPFNTCPQVKTMLFTPIASKVGVTGSMGPFFCEFTVNGDVPPLEYPAVYAHELSHLLGIANEAEANFYAYQVCTRSHVSGIRFSGYFSILFHVLGNARRLLSAEEYQTLLKSVRPEILSLAKESQQYWSAKYSPLIGEAQNRIYELYLKGNKISSGRKNYSEVVGLLISHEEWK